MELFSEIYGCYYTVVAKVLRLAHGKRLERVEIEQFVAENAFAESSYHLIPRLLSGEWDLLVEDSGRYSSKLEHANTALPLTNLQKAWLKSLLSDRRVRLFLEDEQLTEMKELLSGIEPLFAPSNFQIYDAAADGDDYSDEKFIWQFRSFINAIKQKKALLVTYESGKGSRMLMHFLPQKLLYSQKDDKLRALGRKLTGKGSKTVLLNLGRVRQLTESDRPMPRQLATDGETGNRRTVSIAISDERNALERCMLQFASYDKQTVMDEASGRYICDISYDSLEETELLIRILSFGPVLEVLGPEPFLAQVRERVRLQIERMTLGSCLPPD